MAWITYFNAANMAQPLFGDLANEAFFLRAGTRIDLRTIDYTAGSTTVVDTIFRGYFDVAGDIILEGNIRSLTQAVNGSVLYTLTGLSPLGLDIWYTLDVATHRDATALNGYLLAGNDRLDGSPYADVLNGYGGADTLSGGLGNDTYIIDQLIDTVVELAGGGTDTVNASISYVLPAEVERLVLTGIASINGTGNSLANNITGNIGANVLLGLEGNDSILGGLGDDTLDGGPGNDSLNGNVGVDTVTYAASDFGVTVDLSIVIAQNTAGAGRDTITNVENLTGSDLADRLTGNTRDNVIEGRDGDDTLDGGAGIDTASYASADADTGVTVNLSSTHPQNTIGAGIDTLLRFENLLGSAGNDVLNGNVGDNLIAGAAGNDSLTGAAGVDTLVGGVGIDTLTGGAGEDAFVFSDSGSFSGVSPFAHGNAAEVMVISDFVPGTDHIDLSRTVLNNFADLTNHLRVGPLGPLLPRLFDSGPGLTSANSASDRIVYDTNTGNLYFDWNGSSSSGEALIATLTGIPTLTASDIHIIA